MSTIKPGKYVITGAPCTGKTTVINELSKQGYKTMGESSRAALERHPQLRASVASNDDVVKLQRIILDTQIKSEAELGGDETVFLDGGIPSGIAFCRVKRIEPPDELIYASRKIKYDAVFVMDRLPLYETDESRQQTESQSVKLQELIFEVYSELGYSPIKVPAMSPQERVEFIKKFCSV